MKDAIRNIENPTLQDARLVMGFTGWMDGGEVSTGTLEVLRKKLAARPLAEMDCDGFNILSFPASMEASALFRPHCKIVDGLIREYDWPTNRFFINDSYQLILMSAREPNSHWGEFADALFAFAERMNVRRIYFVGSVATAVPHTRTPRVYCSVSEESLKAELEPFRVRFSDYEGPASFVTYLTREAARRGVGMVNLVSEIPVYVNGRNPRCIDAGLKLLATLLNLQLDLTDLRVLCDQWEREVTKAVGHSNEMADQIQKLEEAYDADVFETEMTDVKEWLQARGLRVD